MYTVAVCRDFIASHFLIGGDWGPENELHAQHYKVEVQLEAAELDQHGYLVDICLLEEIMDQQVDQYRDKTLNDLAPFRGLNPSIENFARIICEAVLQKIAARNLSAITIKIWESDTAWAACRRDL